MDNCYYIRFSTETTMQEEEKESTMVSEKVNKLEMVKTRGGRRTI